MLLNIAFKKKIKAISTHLVSCKKKLRNKALRGSHKIVVDKNYSLSKAVKYKFTDFYATFE